MVEQYNIALKVYRRGYHLITNEILQKINKLPEKGLMNIFIKHTSAALTINENADPSVRRDFETSMNNLIIEGASYYTHTQEGVDDMPAYIKSSVFGCSLTIPITDSRLNLGVWQGIYLCEFRNHSSSRNIVVTVYY